MILSFESTSRGPSSPSLAAPENRVYATSEVGAGTAPVTVTSNTFRFRTLPEFAVGRLVWRSTNV